MPSELVSRRTRSIARLVIPRLRRVAASVLALVVIACMFDVQVQEAAVAHARCAKHGRLVHVRAASRRAQDRPTGIQRVARDHELALADHEHCPFAGMRHGIRTAMTAPPIVVAPATRIACQAPPRVHAVVTTYRIAPKTSPPA
jgi:hypothetical protein